MKRAFLALLLFLPLTGNAAEGESTDGWLSHDKNIENTCPKGRLCHSLYNQGKKITEAADAGPSNPACWRLDSFAWAYFPCLNNGDRTSHKGRKWVLHIKRYGDNDSFAYGFLEGDCKRTMTNYPPLFGWCAGDKEECFRHEVKSVECFEKGSEGAE